MGSVVVELAGADELEGLGARALGEVLAALEIARRRVEAQIAVVLGVAERTGAFAEDGHVSVRGWAQATTNWSWAETRVRLQTARMMDELVVLSREFRSGRVGAAQVFELARLHANPRTGHQLVESERLLTGHAQRLSFDEFRVVCRRWESLADADGAHRRHERAHHERSATIVELDGVVHVEGHGGAAQGAAMMEIFWRFCAAEFTADWDATRAAHGDAACKALMPRTDAQRRFDALWAIFEAAAVAPIDGQVPVPLVNIILDEARLEALVAALACEPPPPIDPATVDGRRCETTSGIPLDPADVLAAALVGHVRRVVVDSAGVVIDMGRRRRLFTGAARQAVLLADRRCTWPGCGLPSERCDIDHCRSWAAERGTTSPRDGDPLCGHHNVWKQRRYTHRRDHAGLWHTYRPDGTEIGAPLMPSHDDDPDGLGDQDVA